MKSNSTNRKIIQKISDETGYSPEVIGKIIKWFFLGLRRILYKNGEVNIHGLFKMKLRPHYKRKVNKNPNVNLHARVSGDKKKRKGYGRK